MREYVVTLRGEPVAVLRPLADDEMERYRQDQAEEEIAEMRGLAQEVSTAWTSSKSGVELVEEQRR
jgi:hypothetical protein